MSEASEIIDAKDLVIVVRAEKDGDGYRAEAAGHPDYDDTPTDWGMTPDEARGSLIRTLFLSGHLVGPVRVALRNESGVDDLNPR
jgi:hypothetical protein